MGDLPQPKEVMLRTPDVQVPVIVLRMLATLRTIPIAGRVPPIRWLQTAIIGGVLAIHPVVKDGISDDGGDYSDHVGPSCALTHAPPLEREDGLWTLAPQATFVVPYDLILAGYPESGAKSHHLVTRVTCTAYTSRECETDDTPTITASNKELRPGYIALSRDLLDNYTPGAPFSFGDRIELIGLGTFQVEDTMASRWERRVDIWFTDLDAAWEWGRRELLLAGIADEAQSGGELTDPCQLVLSEREGDMALLATGHSDDT